MGMDFINIGPECFANDIATVISYKGENFYKACDEPVVIGSTGTSHCVKRVGHPGTIHEDWDGKTKTDLVSSKNLENRFNDCTSLDELIGQAVGLGSMCWDTPDGAGVFKSEEASRVVDEVLERLSEIISIRVNADEVKTRRQMKCAQSTEGHSFDEMGRYEKCGKCELTINLQSRE